MNVQQINQHNSNPSKTYTQGINEFTDISHEDFVQKYTGFKMDAANLAKNQRTSPSKPNVKSGSTAPTWVDWRTQGYVLPIKNQGSCGSCWTFATTSGNEVALIRN